MGDAAAGRQWGRLSIGMEPFTLCGLCSSEGPWGPASGVPSLGEDRRNVGVPPTPQVMILVQETPTSPSRDKRERLPNLLPGVTQQRFCLLLLCPSAPDQFVPGIPANSLITSSISVLWERELPQ